GGVVGTSANRLLRTKTVSSGSSAGSIQNSAVTCDNSGNLTGIADLNMSGTLTAATLNPTNALSIAHGGTGQTGQTAAFDALSPLRTRGTFLTNNGSHTVRLGVGVPGQFLQTQGAGANPQWPDAPPPTTVTIASGSMPAAATLTITSIPATYRYIWLQL